MSESKRSTIYFDPELHRALRLKAAATSSTVSDLVNQAVRYAMSEDAEDLEAFRMRESEELISFEDLLKDMKNRGAI